jgi:hypothetical protein
MHGGKMDDATNFALWLVSVVENYAIENLRLKTFIGSLPLAQMPGFSLDQVLVESAQSAGSEQGLRKRFAEVRGTLLEFPHSSDQLRQLQEHIERTKRPG